MSSLEAKIVVLGSQGVGKTSLVERYCKGSFNPSETTSTVGASFMAKRVVDSDSDTVVRLQIWDTAGQERFRSISRLYYRGANACILCYSITDAQSFAEMGIWLTELRRNLPSDIILHVVGTKADIVAREPARREVPFERCIAYVAENLAPGRGSTPPPTATPLGMPGFHHGGGGGHGHGHGYGHGHHDMGGGRATAGGMLVPPTAAPELHVHGSAEPKSPSSKRSSGFWGQEAGWDACHEISAESGEGVEEVFRVVTRKLVEQNRKMQQALLAATATPGGATPYPYHGGLHPGDAGGAGGPGSGSGLLGEPTGYFDGVHQASRGSFRVGRDRRSWLFSPGFAVSPAVAVDQPNAGAAGARGQQGTEVDRRDRQGKCC